MNHIPIFFCFLRILWKNSCIDKVNSSPVITFQIQEFQCKNILKHAKFFGLQNHPIKHTIIA